MNKFKTMGVMNITPNSFSDGNKLKTLKNQKETFEAFINQFDIVDIGAESTAPFNDPIGASEELTRLESFFLPILFNFPDQERIISIDTYRPEVFFEIALIIKKAWPKARLIFNDISGQGDEDLILLLKSDLQFSYVLSHNLAPNRALASNHMDYISELEGKDFVNSICEWFEERLETIMCLGREIIIDPCFGFSKTRQQNHDLLKHFSVFANQFPKLPVLVGVSRKSFMRFPKDMDPKLQQSQLHLDCLQTLVAQNLLNNSRNELIFRTHNIAPFKALSDAAKIF